MTAALVKSMRVQLKVEGGKGPWYNVLAITGPFALETKDAFGGGATHGHFLVVNPDREPKLQWLTPSEIEDVEEVEYHGET